MLVLRTGGGKEGKKYRVEHAKNTAGLSRVLEYEAIY